MSTQCVSACGEYETLTKETVCDGKSVASGFAAAVQQHLWQSENTLDQMMLEWRPADKKDFSYLCVRRLAQAMK
jgi:hypothetical protein